jgi:hypothetical protein
MPDCKQQIKILQAETAKLRKLSIEDRRRADSAGDAMRRAYRRFAATPTRR